MNNKDKSQVKIDLIIQLDDNTKSDGSNNSNLEESPKSSSSSSMQPYLNYIPSKNLDTLLINSSDHTINHKLNALKVFTKCNHKEIIDYLKDSANIFMNLLIKGFNSTLITYGRSKTKTKLINTNNDLNILIEIYNQMKTYSGGIYGINVNFMEIWYDEINKTENVVDLLECTSIGSDNNSHYHGHHVNEIDLYTLTTVTIRSQNELENILNIVKGKSQCFRDNKEIDGNHNSRSDYESQQTDSSNNTNTTINRNTYSNNGAAHFIARMNFINANDKKQFTFSFVDLIGFDHARNDCLEQASLIQINNLFEEFYQNKDRFEAYKLNKAKNTKSGSNKTIISTSNNSNNGNNSSNSMICANMKIVNMISNIILNSQTIILFPIIKQIDRDYSMLQLIDKISKVIQVRYAIEKENIDIVKKMNMMSFANYIRVFECSLENKRGRKAYQNMNEGNGVNPIQEKVNPIAENRFQTIDNEKFSLKSPYATDMNIITPTPMANYSNTTHTITTTITPPNVKLSSQLPPISSANYNNKRFSCDIIDQPIQETEEEHDYNSHTSSIDAIQKYDDLKEKITENGTDFFWEFLQLDDQLQSHKQGSYLLGTDMKTSSTGNNTANNSNSKSTNTNTIFNFQNEVNTYNTNYIQINSLNPSISSATTRMITVESIINSPKSQSTDLFDHLSPPPLSSPSSLLTRPIKALEMRQGMGIGQDNTSNNDKYKTEKFFKKQQISDENYYSNYNSKVKEVLKLLDNISNSGGSSGNSINNNMLLQNGIKQNLSTEYNFLKRNYDILFDLFQEGESIKAKLMNDFISLKDKIKEFKEEYDQKLQNLQNENTNLLKKYEQLKLDLGITDILELYEKDLEYLEFENIQLRNENHNLNIKLNTLEGVKLTNLANNSTGSNVSTSSNANTNTNNNLASEYNALLKKYNELLGLYDSMCKSCNSKEQMILEYKKKVRMEEILMLDKKLDNEDSKKTENINRKESKQRLRDNRIKNMSSGSIEQASPPKQRIMNKAHMNNYSQYQYQNIISNNNKMRWSQDDDLQRYINILPKDNSYMKQNHHHQQQPQQQQGSFMPALSSSILTSSSKRTSNNDDNTTNIDFKLKSLKL